MSWQRIGWHRQIAPCGEATSAASPARSRRFEYEAMLSDAGFDEISVTFHPPGRRRHATARSSRQFAPRERSRAHRIKRLRPDGPPGAARRLGPSRPSLRARERAEGDAATCAHLLEFDSVHSRWPRRVARPRRVRGRRHDDHVDARAEPGDVPWGELGVDVVLECSGRFRSAETLAPYLTRGARGGSGGAGQDAGALNVGARGERRPLRPALHDIVTGASCTRTASLRSSR